MVCVNSRVWYKLCMIGTCRERANPINKSIIVAVLLVVALQHWLHQHDGMAAGMVFRASDELNNACINELDFFWRP